MCRGDAGQRIKGKEAWRLGLGFGWRAAIQDPQVGSEKGKVERVAQGGRGCSALSPFHVFWSSFLFSLRPGPMGSAFSLKKKYIYFFFY